MAFKKKPKIEGDSEPAISATPTEPEAPKREPLQVKESTDKKDRLSFNVSPEGKIDWESMRSETKDKVIEAIKNSPIPGMQVQREPPFSEETLTILWALIGFGEAKLATLPPLKVPPEIAMAIFPYNEEEQKKLTAALNRCLVKYEWLASVKYKEEGDLVGMLFMLFVIKLQTAKQMEKQHREEERQRNEAKRPAGDSA